MGAHSWQANLDRWLSEFGSEQLLVVESADLFRSPQAVAQGVLDFLWLPPAPLDVTSAVQDGQNKGCRDDYRLAPVSGPRDWMSYKARLSLYVVLHVGGIRATAGCCSSSTPRTIRTSRSSSGGGWGGHDMKEMPDKNNIM